MRDLDAMDLFDVKSLLSEEELMVQATVARFVATAVLPIIRECFEKQRFPAELIPELANLGLLGCTLEGYGCAGLGRVCLRLDRPGARARRQRTADVRCRAGRAHDVRDPRIRLGRAEATLVAGDGQRRGHRLLRAQRAARRLRSGHHEDARETQRQ